MTKWHLWFGLNRTLIFHIGCSVLTTCVVFDVFNRFLRVIEDLMQSHPNKDMHHPTWTEVLGFAMLVFFYVMQQCYKYFGWLLNWCTHTDAHTDTYTDTHICTETEKYWGIWLPFCKSIWSSLEVQGMTATCRCWKFTEELRPWYRPDLFL